MLYAVYNPMLYAPCGVRMKHVLGYRCTLCEKEYGAELDLHTCPACGTEGILDIVYDYQAIKKSFTARSLEANRDYSIWRYTPLMTVGDEPLNRTLHVGWTPLYTANRLSGELGLRTLYLKDDGLNPTGSLKDRASVVGVVKALEKKASTIACSSTGNAASSLAGNAARMGLKTVIFVPERAPAGKVTQLLIYGARVISVAGTYHQTVELSQQAIEKWGWYNRNCAINPHLVEGKKTVALEMAEQMNWDVPDWVTVSVGDGCTIGGVYKGFYDLLQLGLVERIPRILGVQAEGAAPFYRAWADSKPLQPTGEDTIADSIAVGVPRNPVKGLNAVRFSQGAWITVTDEEILAAMKELGSAEGIFGEPAGVTGFAGLIKAVTSGQIQQGQTVATIVTGNGLKDIQNALKAAGQPMRVQPDFRELEKIF
jgi:threonine synthase